MDQKYNTKNVQQNMVKTSGMPAWEANKKLKQMAKQGDVNAAKVLELSKKESLSSQGVRGLAKAYQKTGIVKHVGVEQMVNRIKRQMAEEAKVAAEERAGNTAAGWRQERARQEEAKEKGKPGALTSIAKAAPAQSSALAGKKNIAKGEGAFVSAARAQKQTQAPAEKKEEKPVAVDLMID